MRVVRPNRCQGGAALLVLLVALAVLALGQFLMLEHWTAQRQREREAELMFVGDQYVRALASYARSTPAGAARQPQHLEELLEDRRFARPVPHLRRLWPDPFTGRADWGLIRVGDRIIGVHSQAAVQPFGRGPQGRDAGAAPPTVADWRFVHTGVPGF